MMNFVSVFLIYWNVFVESCSSLVYMIDSLWSVSGLKLASSPLIGIHWCHYFKSRSDLRIFLNLCAFQILRSLANLLVRVRVRAYIIGRQFEKSENGNRFDIWDTGLRTWKRTDFCDVEIKHGFEDWTSIRGWISIWVLHIYFFNIHPVVGGEIFLIISDFMRNCGKK